MNNILELINSLFDTLICEEIGWMLLHEPSSNNLDVWRITLQAGNIDLAVLLETKLIDAKVNYKMAYDPNTNEYYILIESMNGEKNG